MEAGSDSRSVVQAPTRRVARQQRGAARVGAVTMSAEGAGGGREGSAAGATQPALRVVYPVLEEGFEKLLKVVEAKGRLDAPPDVDFCPLRFLAEHLMRNNPQR